jgi:hypothetical protein
MLVDATKRRFLGMSLHTTLRTDPEQVAQDGVAVLTLE